MLAAVAAEAIRSTGQRVPEWAQVNMRLHKTELELLDLVGRKLAERYPSRRWTRQTIVREVIAALRFLFRVDFAEILLLLRDPPPALAPTPSPATSLSDHRQTERNRILHALDHAGWNRLRAAESCGIPRRTFYRRLKEYGIQG